MKKIPLFQVDAFTEKPFSGNPAAVCILEEELSDEILLCIAAEMNLSETAFIYTSTSDLTTSSHFHLRWFTPTTEVKLCGHATLSAAKILFDHYHISSKEIFFETLSGVLKAKRVDEGIELDFPLSTPDPIPFNESIIRALNLLDTDVLSMHYAKNSGKILVEVKEKILLATLSPNFESLLYCEFEHPLMGLIVCSKGDDNYDFYSRFFAPWSGINEDPVTGSAHTVLAPYFMKKLNKSTFKAKQLSKRTGELVVSVDESKQRVKILGKSVLITEGTLSI